MNVTVDGRALVVMMPFMTNVRASDLSKPSTNLAVERDRIIADLDYLFLGF